MRGCRRKQDKKIKPMKNKNKFYIALRYSDDTYVEDKRSTGHKKMIWPKTQFKCAKEKE